MGGEEEPDGIARLRLLPPVIEEFLFILCDRSQLSNVPDTRGMLDTAFVAIEEPLRGALEAFPFAIGLGQMT